MVDKMFNGCYLIHGRAFESEVMKAANSLRCIKILSQCHHFLFFLPSPFLPCKDTFMDNYDGT
jgi:hypothetical protein